MDEQTTVQLGSQAPSGGEGDEAAARPLATASSVSGLEAPHSRSVSWEHVPEAEKLRRRQSAFQSPEHFLNSVLPKDDELIPQWQL
jgi:hypothetical protein